MRTQGLFEKGLNEKDFSYSLCIRFFAFCGSNTSVSCSIGYNNHAYLLYTGTWAAQGL